MLSESESALLAEFVHSKQGIWLRFNLRSLYFYTLRLKKTNKTKREDSEQKYMYIYIYKRYTLKLVQEKKNYQATLHIVW